MRFTGDCFSLPAATKGCLEHDTSEPSNPGPKLACCSQNPATSGSRRGPRARCSLGLAVRLLLGRVAHCLNQVQAHSKDQEGCSDLQAPLSLSEHCSSTVPRYTNDLLATAELMCHALCMMHNLRLADCNALCTRARHQAALTCSRLHAIVTPVPDKHHAHVPHISTIYKT